jgi:hypothetical protein
VYKKLLRKGEKYKISTTHRVKQTKKNNVTTESINCKNGDVPRNLIFCAGIEKK